MKYGFEGMAKNEFTGLKIPTGDPNNPFILGDSEIQALGFGDELTIGYCALVRLLFQI